MLRPSLNIFDDFNVVELIGKMFVQIWSINRTKHQIKHTELSDLRITDVKNIILRNLKTNQAVN